MITIPRRMMSYPDATRHGWSTGSEFLRPDTIACPGRGRDCGSIAAHRGRVQYPSVSPV